MKDEKMNTINENVETLRALPKNESVRKYNEILLIFQTLAQPLTGEDYITLHEIYMRYIRQSRDLTDIDEIDKMQSCVAPFVGLSSSVADVFAAFRELDILGDSDFSQQFLRMREHLIIDINDLLRTLCAKPFRF